MIKCDLWWFIAKTEEIAWCEWFVLIWLRKAVWLSVVSSFSALYWYIYYRVHFYIWVVWGLLRSFHVILLVLIKSGWLEFFWKALYFDFYEVHIRKGHIQEIEIASEPIYKKRKITVYIYKIIERKKTKTKTKTKKHCK